MTDACHFEIKILSHPCPRDTSINWSFSLRQTIWNQLFSIVSQHKHDNCILTIRIVHTIYIKLYWQLCHFSQIVSFDKLWPLSNDILWLDKFLCPSCNRYSNLQQLYNLKSIVSKHIIARNCCLFQWPKWPYEIQFLYFICNKGNVTTLKLYFQLLLNYCQFD